MIVTVIMGVGAKTTARGSSSAAVGHDLEAAHCARVGKPCPVSSSLRSAAFTADRGRHECWSRYRVVDLTDERGNLAAFILAGLGADVVLVEPPGGSGGPPARPVRRRRRRHRALADVLGLEPRQAQRRARPRRRRRPAGARRGCAPTPTSSSSAAPSTSTSPPCAPPTRRSSPCRSAPFGSTGPKADWPATDLTVNAAGCQLAITGDDDRPPVRTAVPQAFLHAVGRRRRRRAAGADRARGQRPRPARRGLRPALDDAGHAELRARRPARRQRRRSG